MSHQIITAEHVQQVAPGGTLTLPKNAVVTSHARDVAADRKVTFAEGDTESKVREIVARVLTGGALTSGSAPTRGIPPVKHIRMADAVPERFPYVEPKDGQQIDAVDVVTSSDGSPVAAGYLTLTKGSFPWTLAYDEIQVILEGELHLGGDGGGKIGRPGDVLFVPKGSSVIFETPTWVKFVYVTFPADWENEL